LKREINSVLVANRSVPAVRIIHTCRDRKIGTTAVYSTPDSLAHHVYLADKAVHVGEAPPLESYLNVGNMIDAAVRSGCDAVHPGWGFLAENAEFARKVMDAGLIWIGPSPEVISLMGDKVRAKEIAIKAQVPVIPGISNVKNVDAIRKWMKKDNIAFPIMIKAASGGGGKGMVKVEKDDELTVAFSQSRSEAEKAFGDSTLLAEKFIEHGRHIEVQIVGDEHGNLIHLFERECTLQRRNQKIIEEAPSPSIDSGLRLEVCATALRLMREINYTSAGTVEFIFDPAQRRFYFLEVNTRLQVEHGITELVTGVDIVSLMIDVAMGLPLPIHQDDIRPNRWAIEARLNAEDPINFNPSFGKITRLQIPFGPAVRIANGVYEGAEIPAYYDSLFMLLMAAGVDREHAIHAMDRTLSRSLRVEGIKTNKPLLKAIIRHPAFIAGDFSTHFIEEHLEELVAAFPDTTFQDEALKIARYVAEISALGPREWV